MNKFSLFISRTRKVPTLKDYFDREDGRLLAFPELASVVVSVLQLVPQAAVDASNLKISEISGFVPRLKENFLAP